jgi:23S rRNA (cytidine1920-2'-O)/16S rRNA (cytidine1409-2'-O)-methyltransferase
MPQEKERLDQLLVEKGFFESKTKAQAAILAGMVFVDGEKNTKQGTKLLPSVKIEVKGKPHPYVSRGGVKLEHALKEFKINAEGRVCLDIGASTGGFTDCLLQKGAKLVYAIDVGYGQFDWKLRNDPRVVLLERTNARYLTAERLYGGCQKSVIPHLMRNPEPLIFTKKISAMPQASLAVIDVSFISLEKILPTIKNLLPEKGEIIALIKPQFEAGRDKIEKGGIVSDPKVHQMVIEKIINFAKTLNLKNKGLIPSPISGQDGNVEFLVYLIE